MTASNHTITGAVIATMFPNPLIAVPAALASHVVLDALPHYGSKEHTDRKFLVILGTDATLAAIVLFMIFIAQPSHWLLMISCGVVAAAPDLLWFPRWVQEMRGQISPPPNAINRFLSRVQWAEFNRGWIFELPYFVGGLYFLVPALSR